MRRFAVRLAFIAGLLSLPTSAFALVPPNVTGLEARVDNGRMEIRWNAPEGENDIASYRVYYSQESILDNDGAYDDFIGIDGSQTELILTDLPPFPEIYLAVAAVSSADEESESFVEEVRLEFSSPVAEGERREREVPSPSRRERETGSIGLIGASNPSLTEIVLEFTAPAQIAPEQASDAVAVTDSEGRSVRLHQLILLGNTVTLMTDPLIPGTSYAVRVNPVLTGYEDDRTLPLDPVRSIGSFTAAGQDAVPSPAPAPQVAAQGATAPVETVSPDVEVHNFRTHVEPEGDTGRSTVVIGWDPPAVGLVTGYEITPIVGKKLGKTTSLAPETTVVRFRKIPPGLFRVAVRTTFTDGSTAGPTTISVTVPGETWEQAAAPDAASVSQPPRSGALSHTGAGATGIALVSAGLAAFRRFRRKRADVPGTTGTDAAAL